MNSDSKIVIFGGTGLLGSAIARQLKKQNYTNVTYPSHKDGFDLLNVKKISDYLIAEKPEYIFMVAGLVGGIYANNTHQADFLYQNAMMILNVLETLKNVSPHTKMLYTGSTCVYPRENPQPINEDRFMAGKLEDTNTGYAIAKGMGIVACQMYRKQYGINSICAMPTNLYGLNDNYDLESSHFIPAVFRKIVDAKKSGVPPVFWGSGKPRREALFSEDCADALIFLMNNYNKPEIVNIGTGFDNSIKEYVEIVCGLVNYKGEIKWDSSKPDGMLEKRTDIARLKSLMPDFSPKLFQDGAKIILKETFNLD
ncbi:MAG TPA: GDP-L-fucose synthase, partial [Ignavibacteria bacterium]|nr:GDP-L-fucose synthase [Ignavibacteria bacterium]